MSELPAQHMFLHPPSQSSGPCVVSAMFGTCTGPSASHHMIEVDSHQLHPTESSHHTVNDMNVGKYH